ncbi:ADP-ribosyltransferse [Mycobacterium lentiflavum]|uniref:ADP-ribosyltransferse n=1 Tax=Mycobacterium lentiflavum TaxID=141349 RepID=A0A0E4GZB9_MYCLN|nr:ADP-ribosyltransferase [Mycobacterium lentiflavum]CQD15616.1 ADP-ribosyltransferse [Mycobacterium lentiflavum]
MAPIAVDPDALSAAGSAVVAAGDGLDAAMAVLTAGFGANTGLDVAGEVFGLSYQATAESLLKAAAAAINACRRNGVMIQVGASNWSKAEAASRLGGGASVLHAPAEPAQISAPGPPGTLGPGEPPPLLWAVVQSFVDDVWPNGDVAALHSAAGCWRTFSSAVSGMQDALDGSRTLVGTQQIPEGEKINQVLSQIGVAMGKLGAQCWHMATVLDDFADRVAKAQNDIRNLLQRLESLTDVWHDIVSILDGDALEEVKKIARDVNAVLHDLGRQARAFEQGIKLLMQVADGLVVDMEKFMRGQFTHFLGDAVGNQAATVFDTFVNANEGVVKGAAQTALGLGDLAAPWLLLDPKGAEATWKDMMQSQFRASLLNEVLHPREGVAANLQMWKSLLHLDDWSTARPGLGFGENVFDGATLFVPGIGEAGAGAKAGSAAARGAEEAAEGAGAAGRVGELGEFASTTGALGDIGKAGTNLTKDLDNLKLDLPKTDLPAGGRPVSPPPLEAPKVPPRPVEPAPPGTPAPHSPTAPGSSAPGRPESPVGPHESAPTPGGAPHEPASVPAGGPREATSVPATLNELPMAKVPAEPIQTPLPASSAVAPAEHAPTAAGQPASAPVHPTPPVQAPEFGPLAGQRTEPPGPPIGAPAGSEEGKLPHGQPSESGPHGPGDGGADDGQLADGDAVPNAHEPLSSDHLAALADYTGSGYQDLNHGLRNGTVDASQAARVDALNRALEKLPTYEGTVIRGSDLPDEVLAQYKPGEVFTELGFLSTTTDVAVARSPVFSGNVEFQIVSTSGRDVSSFSMFPEEQEILFPSGSRFYVVDKVMDPVTGRTIIKMLEY